MQPVGWCSLLRRSSVINFHCDKVCSRESADLGGRAGRRVSSRRCVPNRLRTEFLLRSPVARAQGYKRKPRFVRGLALFWVNESPRYCRFKALAFLSSAWRSRSALVIALMHMSASCMSSSRVESDFFTSSICRGATEDPLQGGSVLPQGQRVPGLRTASMGSRSTPSTCCPS